MKIFNYKLIEFINLSSEEIEPLILPLKYLNPKETKRKITSLSLMNVEMIKRYINSADFGDLVRIISKVQEEDEKKVFDFKIVEFFGLLSSVRKQLNVIVKAEENGLSPSFVDPKWQIVKGSERMSKFGIYNTLDNLSNEDATKYDYYRNMKYSEAFTILLMRKEKADIQREMSKIKTGKK